MKKIFAICMAALMLSVCTLSAYAYIDVYSSEQRVYENADTVLPYRLIKPEEYDENQSYPLVIFLHGAGERGNDNTAQLQNCVRFLANKLPPCFIVAPQCAAEQQWVDTPWADGAYSIAEVPESNELKAVMELLSELQNEFSVDTDRIYAAGLSMGAFGVWDLLMRHNSHFAAGIAVCGGGDVSQAEVLKNTPLFVFHGGADGTVPVSGSRDTVQAIRDAGGELVQYVEYPSQGHNIWDTAFAHKDLLSSLFDHKLSDRPIETTQIEETTLVTEAESTATQKNDTEAVSDDKASGIPTVTYIICAVLLVAAVAAVALITRKKQK